MDALSQLKAFKHRVSDALKSRECQVSLFVVGVSFAVRVIAPQVFLAATFVLVVSGCLSSAILNSVRRYQDDCAFGREHGCFLPRELPKRWPLGIDRIMELWKSNAEGRLLDFLCGIAKDYEPQNTLYQYLLVGPRAYHILTPPNVEALLSTNFKDFGFGCRPAVFAPLLGDGIFTQEGAAWKHSRELLRKQFARAKYQHLDRSFGEHVDNLISCIPNQGVVDLQSLFFGLTLDSTTALLFGQSVYSLRASIDQDTENKLFAESFNIAQEGLAKRFRLAPFHWVYNPRSFRKACRTVHEFVEKYIYERGLMERKDNEDETTKRESMSWFVDEVAAESATETNLERSATQRAPSGTRYDCLLLELDISPASSTSPKT